MTAHVPMWPMLLLFVIFPLSLSSNVARNSYDPHYPSCGRGLWFEGWYTRIVDSKNGRSFGYVGGSYCASNKDCGNMQDLPGYFGFIYQTHRSEKFMAEEELKLEHTKLTVGEPTAPVTSNPNYSAPANIFQWNDGLGNFFTNSSVSIQIPEKNIVFTAEFTEPLVWNPKNPGEGPEGWAARLPLPAHWFVYSLRSAVSYNFQTAEGVLRGTGYAHQEKNWGSNFPPKWVWMQAVSDDGQYQFVLSGGDVFTIGPVAINSWLVGWRSPDRSWNFHPANIPTIYTPTVAACNGTFKMVASHFSQKLVIESTAPLTTFQGIAVPTAKGFVKNGCVESYAAKTTVKVFTGTTLLETVVFQGAALEFGGGYMCENQ